MAFRAYEVVRVACESHSRFVLYAPGETGLKQTNYATGVSQRTTWAVEAMPERGHCLQGNSPLYHLSMELATN